MKYKFRYTEHSRAMLAVRRIELPEFFDDRSAELIEKKKDSFIYVIKAKVFGLVLPVKIILHFENKFRPGDYLYVDVITAFPQRKEFRRAYLGGKIKIPDFLLDMPEFSDLKTLSRTVP